jgi:hypothetical protein
VNDYPVGGHLLLSNHKIICGRYPLGMAVAIGSDGDWLEGPVFGPKQPISNWHGFCYTEEHAWMLTKTGTVAGLQVMPPATS